MKKHMFLLCCILLISLPGTAWAQDAATPTTTPSPEPTASAVPEEADDSPEVPRTMVHVESAFIRVLPDQESAAIGSVFLDDPLEVVGRNADGTWFEVRRPGRAENLGWLFNEMVDWEFEPERLPMTDNETGILGPEPIPTDGYAIYIRENAVMRDGPEVRAARLRSIPHSNTITALERNQIGSWIKVNYLGYVGWIAGFNTRTAFDVMELPQAANLPPIPVRIIVPPEIQLAQVQRLREYVTENYNKADQLATFWQQVSRGQIMPCEAPAYLTEYVYTDEDIQQLPELDRLVPRLDQAIISINEAIDPLTECGVLTHDIVAEARADAINARVIFNANLGQINILEGIIR